MLLVYNMAMTKIVYTVCSKIPEKIVKLIKSTCQMPVSLLGKSHPCSDKPDWGWSHMSKMRFVSLIHKNDATR